MPAFAGHTTGRADFRHPAFRLASPQGTRRPTAHLLVSGDDTSARDGLRQAVELSLKVPDLIRRCQAHHQSPSPHHLQKRTRSRGPLLHRHYPASTLLLPRPTPAVTTAYCDAEAATPVRDGSPPVTANHPSDVPCPLPRRIAWVRVSITSPRVRPSPNDRRVGIRIRTFEACSGFTFVTAHRIAQEPKAAFVAGLQPSQLPGRAACQLPDQSTIIRVRPSLTDSSRPRGAVTLVVTRTSTTVSSAARSYPPGNRRRCTSCHALRSSRRRPVQEKPLCSGGQEER